VTVIQRDSSELCRNPLFQTLFLDGVYLLGPEGVPPVFQAAPKSTQEDIEDVVGRANRRILRYLEMRGVIPFASVPGDDEVNGLLDESLGEAGSVLARLFSAATAGVASSGPTQRRAPMGLRKTPLPCPNLRELPLRPGRCG
jgi:hypothetical protein